MLEPLAPFETAQLAVTEAHPAEFQKQLFCIYFESVEPLIVEHAADAPSVLWLVLFSSPVANIVHVSPHVLTSFHLECAVHLSPSVLFSSHIATVVHVSPVLSSFHLAGAVHFFFDNLPVFLLALSSFHLADVVYSTTPFSAHAELGLWPGPDYFALWHLQLQPSSSHFFLHLVLNSAILCLCSSQFLSCSDIS